jgi:hypothetical protein
MSSIPTTTESDPSCFAAATGSPDTVQPLPRSVRAGLRRRPRPLLVAVAAISIAGIVAAIVGPIDVSSGDSVEVEEGKFVASSIRTEIDVYKVKYNLLRWEPVSGTWDELHEHFEGEALNTEYNVLYHFNEEDFHVEFRADGSYTITVDGTTSTHPYAPTLWRYRLHSDGRIEEP